MDTEKREDYVKFYTPKFMQTYSLDEKTAKRLAANRHQSNEKYRSIISDLNEKIESLRGLIKEKNTELSIAGFKEVKDENSDLKTKLNKIKNTLSSAPVLNNRESLLNEGCENRDFCAGYEKAIQMVVWELNRESIFSTDPNPFGNSLSNLFE